MSAKEFFESDFSSSLFPLKTNLILIQKHHVALAAYVAKVLSDDPAHLGDNFLPQTRVHAAKPKNHLRRTVVLDPVASYFLYDLVFRNRAAFGKHASEKRMSFGYGFEDDQPIAVHRSYQEFLDVTSDCEFEFAHSISFDVASYFNSIYHHDATNWFASLPNVSGADANAFGRFFREINSGRSIDFLPQGIYPAKMIGSEFLSFIESTGQIKCARSLRFMDDIHLFDNDLNLLQQDFQRIQELLGLRSLNVNPTKTVVDGAGASVDQVASAIQSQLALIVDDSEMHSMYIGSGVDSSIYDEDEDEDEDEDDQSLDEDQINQLLELLLDPTAEEADVEKILGILLEHTEMVAGYFQHLIFRFPNIVKQLYKLAGLIEDKETLTDQLAALVESDQPLIEYQLFWIAVIAEDWLSECQGFGKLIMAIYEKTANHKIARAKVLEIPNQTFGLKEIREEILKSGASDWQSWAAAVGTRTLKKAARNHALKYFAKGSPLNYLIAECVQGLP